MSYMYFTKEDILEAEHMVIATCAMDGQEFCDYVNGVVDYVAKLFRNNAEKENG